VDEQQRYRWPDAWRADVAPAEPGTALVFSQDTPHEGVPVGAGHTKVIIPKPCTLNTTLLPPCQGARNSRPYTLNTTLEPPCQETRNLRPYTLNP
jgi:hypothetical protein